MERGSIILELSRSLVLPRTREDIAILTTEAIPTMEEVHITTMAPGMGMEMEEAAAKIVPSQEHPLRRT